VTDWATATPFGVGVWSVDLDSPPWPGAAELPAEERARAARLLSPAKRRRWLAARWALRMVLGDYLGQPAAAIELKLGRGGKPELADPASDLRFNLSHSHGRALVAVCPGREVGVDLERIGRRPASFYAEWTRREALAKCFGSGLWAPLPELPASVAKLDVGAGFAAALAIEDACSGTQRRVRRIAGTRQAASVAIASPILEEPARRSRKTIGTSTTRKPARIAR
jgi:4'-phosphopantetheinyl transferase